MDEKQAAIDMDEIKQMDLSEISAANFLAALNASDNLSYFAVWPEKKKYELWVEPENLGTVKVGKLIDILQGEKKKVELEKMPGVEGWRDPMGDLINPVVYERLVDRITRDVMRRM